MVDGFAPQEYFFTALRALRKSFLHCGVLLCMPHSLCLLCAWQLELFTLPSRFLRKSDLLRVHQWLLLLTMLFSVSGCFSSLKAHRQPFFLPEKCWLSETAVYEIRQSIRLEWQGRVESFEAFTVLDLRAAELRQVIFSQLGVTLLTLQIDSQGSRATGPLASGFAGQRFAKLLTEAWRRIYLDLRPNGNGGFVSRSGQRPTLAGDPPRLFSLAGPSGVVEYSDYRPVGNSEIPYRITLHNAGPEYVLTVIFLSVTEDRT